MKTKLMILLAMLLLFLAITGCSSVSDGQNKDVAENSTSPEIADQTPIPAEESNSNEADSNSESNDNASENNPKEEATEKPELVLGSLKKIVSDGCSCSAENPADRSKNSDELNLLFITELGGDPPAYLNVNGKDTKFELVKRGNRSNAVNSKTPYEDVYEADGMTAKIKYVYRKSACPQSEECEASEYGVTITLIKDKQIVKKNVDGICGC